MGSDEAIGVTVRRLRMQQGITLVDFAEQVGVSRPTVWSWEIGKTRPKDRRIPALARALNVPESYLILSSQEVTDSQKKRTIEEEVAHSKERLAAAAGTTPDMIEITLKLQRSTPPRS